jgi:hypothetical protein
MKTYPVIFRYWPKAKDVIALFPESLTDGSCNSGNLMSYQHLGQHGEASYPMIVSCTRPAKRSQFADLLRELRGIYEHGEDAVRLVIKSRVSRK